jgi:2-methylisocitrate lyase-like PEP mutase family enzyme
LCITCSAFAPSCRSTTSWWTSTTAIAIPKSLATSVSILEASGASGVVLEDQKRPRRCGHFEGKQIMDLDEYLSKLKQVLATRRDLFVVARTDSSDLADIERRVLAFAEAGADAVLVDGLKSLDLVRDLSKKVKVPFCFNQIAGGKSPACTLTELKDAGAPTHHLQHAVPFRRPTGH